MQFLFFALLILTANTFPSSVRCMELDLQFWPEPYDHFGGKGESCKSIGDSWNTTKLGAWSFGSCNAIDVQGDLPYIGNGCYLQGILLMYLAMRECVSSTLVSRRYKYQGGRINRRHRTKATAPNLEPAGASGLRLLTVVSTARRKTPSKPLTTSGLQLNTTKKLWPQPAQKARAKPWQRRPHFRYSRKAASTWSGTWAAKSSPDSQAARYVSRFYRVI